MNYPSWWKEAAETIIVEANKKNLIPKEQSYSIDLSGIEKLRQHLMAKGDKPATYLLSEDCRKLIEWRDGGK